MLPKAIQLLEDVIGPSGVSSPLQNSLLNQLPKILTAGRFSPRCDCAVLLVGDEAMDLDEIDNLGFMGFQQLEGLASIEEAAVFFEKVSLTLGFSVGLAVRVLA